MASFIIRCSPAIFAPTELELLRARGTFYEALMVGAWAPTTRAQRHFVDVCRGLAAPETEDEQAWRKYCRRVAWESDPANRAAMGTLRRVVDTSWGGSRETYRHMKGQDTADLARRYRGE